MSRQNWIKKNLDLESFYKEVNDIFDKRGSLEEKIGRGRILELVFLDMLWLKAQQKVDEYIGIQSENQCSVENPVQYTSGHFEPILWMLGLISLSWLIVNLKSKTEDGHCYNKTLHQSNLDTHGHPMCSICSTFHKGFYDSLLSTLNQLVEFGSAQNPSVIDGENNSCAASMGKNTGNESQSTGHSWSFETSNNTR